ncbi:MAG: DnaA N-terminal domain-containing protein, partial [Hyphomicrobiaceae bacterium]
MTHDRDFAPRSEERGADEGALYSESGQNGSGFIDEPVGFVPAPAAAATPPGGGDQDRKGGRPGGSAESDVPLAGAKTKAALRARLGEDVYSSWFKSLEFLSFDGELLKVTVPVKFLRTWIQSHYAEALVACAATDFPGVRQVEVHVRQPNMRQPAAPLP